jgi:Fic family protein
MAKHPQLVDEMCQYANDTTAKAPIHTSAFLLWRVNWIHPFAGVNGRIARAVSYLALCIRLGFVLPGSPTIPEQIDVSYRTDYYRALGKADVACSKGIIDIGDLEKLLEKSLQRQLASEIEEGSHLPRH